MADVILGICNYMFGWVSFADVFIRIAGTVFLLLIMCF